MATKKVTLQQFYKDFTAFVRGNEKRWEGNEKRWVSNEKRWEQNKKEHQKTRKELKQYFNYLDKDLMKDRKRIERLETHVFGEKLH